MQRARVGRAPRTGSQSDSRTGQPAALAARPVRHAYTRPRLRDARRREGLHLNGDDFSRHRGPPAVIAQLQTAPCCSVLRASEALPRAFRGRCSSPVVPFFRGSSIRGRSKLKFWRMGGLPDSSRSSTPAHQERRVAARARCKHPRLSASNQLSVNGSQSRSGVVCRLLTLGTAEARWRRDLCRGRAHLLENTRRRG